MTDLQCILTGDDGSPLCESFVRYERIMEDTTFLSLEKVEGRVHLTIEEPVPLAGLRQPTSGTVHIDAGHEKIAVLPDAPRFDPWLTGREVVSLAARLTGSGDGDAAIGRALEETGLTEAAGHRVGGYSRGMLQRLGIAATVVTRPGVMLMDEPASALDPETSLPSGVTGVTVTPGGASKLIGGFSASGVIWTVGLDATGSGAGLNTTVPL